MLVGLEIRIKIEDIHGCATNRKFPSVPNSHDIDISFPESKAHKESEHMVWLSIGKVGGVILTFPTRCHL